MIAAGLRGVGTVAVTVSNRVAANQAANTLLDSSATMKLHPRTPGAADLAIAAVSGMVVVPGTCRRCLQSHQWLSRDDIAVRPTSDGRIAVEGEPCGRRDRLSGLGLLE